MLNDPAQFRNIGCWLQHWANLSPDKVAFHFIGDDGNETGALSYLTLLNDTQRVIACSSRLNETGSSLNADRVCAKFAQLRMNSSHSLTVCSREYARYVETSKFSN